MQPRSERVHALQLRIAQVETAHRGSSRVHSTGLPALDELLPGRGVSRGGIIEWIGVHAGATAGYLALRVAAAALADEGTGVEEVLVVVDQPIARPDRPLTQYQPAARARGDRFQSGDTFGLFYPPVAAAVGIDPRRIVLIRPTTEADGLWAIDQSLRSPAVAAVWSELPHIEGAAARRLQLAAEEGSGLGLLVRPPSALSEPSWADVRWEVRGMAIQSSRTGGTRKDQATVRRIQVKLLRCRGARSGATCVLEIEETHTMNSPLATTRNPLPKEPIDATGSLHLAAELAHPTRHSASSDRFQSEA
jgi:protein ImuA